MGAPASMVACLLLSALAVASAGGVTLPAPQGAAAADPPREAANPCDHIPCVLDGRPQGAHTAATASPGEGGRGVVCCCCPPGYGRSCCTSSHCWKAPSPPTTVLA
ncbi:unnamed protein product [Urochloa humidicola]